MRGYFNSHTNTGAARYRTKCDSVVRRTSDARVIVSVCSDVDTAVVPLAGGCTSVVTFFEERRLVVDSEAGVPRGCAATSAVVGDAASEAAGADASGFSARGPQPSTLSK